ncbi:M20 family metallopeptidase [Alicyclobacillus sp. ALC3]|uniref:M20 family metallopeptidase n=1 Tax=Alicyclobacillus sp. ALC3 TaxID=2796143 RepID=UPI002378F0C5|nr:M20 family metallopeptidase [Alicyclobacillus sp. ALC3]WDL98420.1 M20 family metallopeptidase [Alicyclobacillus sp. ALC3]
MSQIYDYLKAHQQQMLAQVEQLVRSESPSTDKSMVDACGQLIARMVQSEFGVEPEVFHQSEQGDHLCARVGQGEKKVLILAHFDTVWEVGRLPYRVDGDVAFGPGIFDMKSGIVQALWALKAIRACGQELPVEVTFLFTSDEEIGSPSSRPIIEELAKDSDIALVVEPSVGKSGALKVARKGTADYLIQAHGIAAHAGNHPEDGASAIHELCAQVGRIIELQDPARGTTVNVGKVVGGSRSNVVADHAAIEVDVRFAEPDEAARIEAEMRSLASIDERVTLTVQGGINRLPLHQSEDSRKLFETAKQIAATQLGFQLESARVGGGSDGNFTAGVGTPTLDGLGPVGDGPHAEHEHIVVSGLPQRAALLAHLLLEM